MNQSRRVLVFALGLLITFGLSGCAVLDDILPEVRSIELLDETVKESHYIDDFDLRSLKLRVITRNWETQIVDVQAYMLSPEDRRKIEQAGHHRITIRYRGQVLVHDLIIRQRITAYAIMRDTL
ncbi:MAG: hypothetical protein EA374_01245 [Acholeplasmatales bacterium]|nr:MAG: hypothetical protein EA374_01245 [Acholeplasmatales bacterium]